MSTTLKKYKTKVGLRINGKEYPPGAIVELSDADADRMHSVIEAITPKPAKKEVAAEEEVSQEVVVEEKTAKADVKKTTQGKAKK